MRFIWCDQRGGFLREQPQTAVRALSEGGQQSSMEGLWVRIHMRDGAVLQGVPKTVRVS